MPQIQVRRGTTAQWTAANPILAAGEPGYDTTLEVFKIGNGTDPWLTLPAGEGMSEADADARYAPIWQASTAYATGDTVLLPAPISAVGKRTAAGTSRATFDATEQGLWTVAAGGGTTTVDGLTDATVVGKAVAKAASAAAARTAIDAASPAQITAAINGLVNSAPGQLDTLKELSDALGGDQNYAATVTAALASKATLTPDSARPGLYFFSNAVATDGALAAASSYYKSAALASGSTRLKFVTLGDSTNDGFGAPGGPSSWAKVWPLKLAELLRSQLGRPAGGRGWIPPSPPVGPASYSFNTAQQLPAGRSLDALNFQIGIPGALWLQRAHATNADEVVYTLSAGVTAVDVLTTGYGGNMVFTAANAGASITKDSAGDRVITRVTNPGATLSIRGSNTPSNVGLALLGIIEHVGDEGAGITQVNLSQASIRAFEVAGWLTESDKSMLPLINMYQPHVALITLGSNDMSTGRTQAEMSSAMTAIVSQLRSVAAQIEVVFIVRPDPSSSWTAYGNNIIATAATLGARSLDLRGQLASPALYVADGVHFNEAGEDAMAALLLDYMKVGV